MLTRDRLPVLAVLVAGAVEVLVRDGTAVRLTVVVTAVLLALALSRRRTHPLAAVVTGFGGLAALDVLVLLAGREPVQVSTGLFVLLLVVALARWGRGRQLVLGAAVVLAVVALTVTRQPTELLEVVGGLVLLALAAAVGASTRYRQAALDAGTARVRSQERELLARELHDTVAHHVSGIAVQAQAGQALAASGDLVAATAALRRIETEASATLTEMRGLVGTLRRQDGTREDGESHGLADVAALAAPASPGRPEVAVAVDLPGPADDVPAAVATAVHRVAREAVTNAVRHARDARLVQVRVSGDDRSVTVRVDDDGRRGPAAPRRPGYGLVGMAERVALLGGTLVAGPEGEQGWTVVATLPLPTGTGRPQPRPASHEGGRG